MKHSVLSCMLFLIAMAVVGCTKSPTTQPKAQPATDGGGKKSVAADTTKQLPGPAPAADTSAAETAKGSPPADTTPAVPPADTKEMDTPAAEPAKSDVTPPAEAAATKLPYEDLVAALGNDRYTVAYRQVEQQLAEKPADVEARAMRAWILNLVGSELARGDKRDKGLEVFGVALEQAQALVASESSLPDDISQALSAVYYNGACAQSLGGKPEDAKTTLAKAVELGFSDLNAIKSDEDLAAVRALAGFDQQLEAWTALMQEALAKQAREVLATGESFPFDFAVTDLAGQNISLTGYQGKVLITDIWGTWCPPCRAEIPSFVKLQTEYGPQGLQIVGLNYENNPDEAATKEGVQKFMQDNGMNYPCALGTEEIQRQVPNFEGYPTTLFIDRTGKVRAKVVGSHDYAFLEAIVKILLEEAAPPAANPAATPPAATPEVSATPAAPDAAAPPASARSKCAADDIRSPVRRRPTRPAVAASSRRPTFARPGPPRWPGRSVMRRRACGLSTACAQPSSPPAGSSIPRGWFDMPVDDDVVEDRIRLSRCGHRGRQGRHSGRAARSPRKACNSRANSSGCSIGGECPHWSMKTSSEFRIFSQNCSATNGGVIESSRPHTINVGTSTLASSSIM